MELLCPKCHGSLTEQGGALTCAVCGNAYGAASSGADSAPAAETSALPATPPAAPPIAAAAVVPPAVPADDRIRVACPVCGRRFLAPISSIGKKGSCPCGNIFIVAAPPEPAALPPLLMSAAAGAAAASAAPARVKCANHPGADATFACAACHAFICPLCAFPSADGRQLCPSCAASGGMAPGAFAVASPMQGVMCRVHPANPAVAYCRKCGAPSCGTCDFMFPGNIHYCPTCAAASQTEISPRRKRRMYWSLGLGVFSILCILVMLLIRIVGPSAVEVAIVAAGCFLMSGIASLVGTGIGVSAMEKRLRNPPLLWAGVICNGVVLAIWVLLVIIGNLSRT